MGGMRWRFFLGGLLCSGLAGCSKPDWDRICADFKAKASQCSTSSVTLVASCDPNQFGSCANESDLADDIESCTAQDCAGFRDCATDPRACAAGGPGL
jgi:hypothetical protein